MQRDEGNSKERREEGILSWFPLLQDCNLNSFLLLLHQGITVPTTALYILLVQTVRNLHTGHCLSVHLFQRHRVKIHSFFPIGEATLLPLGSWQAIGMVCKNTGNLYMPCRLGLNIKCEVLHFKGSPKQLNLFSNLIVLLKKVICKTSTAF